MKKRFSEEQIIGILKEAGLPVKALCRKHYIFEITFCTCLGQEIRWPGNAAAAASKKDSRGTAVFGGSPIIEPGLVEDFVMDALVSGRRIKCLTVDRPRARVHQQGAESVGVSA